jgi:lipopolysaccharide transport system ATP-binding protein
LQFLWYPLAVTAQPPAVHVEKVVKRFPVFRRRRDRLRFFLGLARGLEFHAAVDGVSFTAARGEAVGLIGENGSGKTTLLRLLMGVTEPDEGVIQREGPVAGILELGAGFHTDLTARENLLLYGAALGRPTAEVRQLIPEILAFAELEAFADQPLYSFSSGMTARLAFAAATCVSPAVLVVDEALAVGDGAFQRKCIQRMVSFRDSGKTVVFCSHAMYQVAEFCARAVWLRHGRVAADGPAAEVIRAYERYLRRRRSSPPQQGAPSLSPPVVPEAWVVDLQVDPPDPCRPGQPLSVRLTVGRSAAGLPVHVALSFETAEGVVLALVGTHWDGVAPLTGGCEESVRLVAESFPAAQGPLDVTAYVADERALRLYDQRRFSQAVQIRADGWAPALVVFPHRWELG